MDLLSIVQALLRNKRFVIPVIILTAIAALYIDKMQPRVYQSAASVLLENPQGQATKAQISADPSLATANPYNPLLGYGSLDVAANAVLDLINGPAAQSELAQKGVDPRYTLTLSTDTGSPPIIDISGVGDSAQAAIDNATILMNTIKTDLYKIQQEQGTNPFYMITVAVLIKPDQANHASSGKTKSLAALGGIGIILLFVVVSAADAREERRRKSRGNVRPGQSAAYPADPREPTPADDLNFTGNAMSSPRGNPDPAPSADRYPAGPRYPEFRREN